MRRLHHAGANQLNDQCCNARSPREVERRRHALHRAVQAARYSLPPSSPRLSPSSITVAPACLNVRVQVREASSISPTTPSTGVG